MIKILISVFLGLVASLGVGELVARYVLGLGTPPLYVSSPEIEYMFAPNQDLQRFGNRFIINETGMRSSPLSQVKQVDRVLVFGDSVVNGGNLTDHADLATTILTNADTFYGNVSAGSWGPANISAWIDRYGFLKAETAVLVLSSHDLEDLPTFLPLNPNTHPTTKPLSALVEGIERYLPRYLPPFISEKMAWHPPLDAAPRLWSDDAGVAAINALIEKFHQSQVKLCLVQHQTQSELQNGPRVNHNTIKGLFNARGLPSIDDGTYFQALLAQGKNPYRDNIHVNPVGQVALAAAIQDCTDMAVIPTAANEN